MPIATQPAATLQAAAAATADGASLDMAGVSSVVVQILGTFVGTVTWEGSVDGGTTWAGLALASLSSTTRARAATATAPGLHLLDQVPGLGLFRARISAYTSGAITVIAAPGIGA